MSEDYTWDETITAHGYAVQNAEIKRANERLAARVQELEAQLNAAILGQRQLERENAELRARANLLEVENARLTVLVGDLFGELADATGRTRAEVEMMFFEEDTSEVQP